MGNQVQDQDYAMLCSVLATLVRNVHCVQNTIDFTVYAAYYQQLLHSNDSISNSSSSNNRCVVDKVVFTLSSAAIS